MKASEMTNEELAKALMSRVPLDSDRHDDLREAAARLRNLGEIGEAVGREATHEKSSQVGNAAKIREALSDACYAMFNFLKTQNGGYEEMAKALDKAKAALAEPPRNCDVGTAEEQQDRFREFCRRHFDARECGLGRSVAKCPAYQGGKNPDCSLWWAQMPYEEGGAEWMV